MPNLKYLPSAGKLILILVLFVANVRGEYGSQNSNFVLGGLGGATSFVNVPHNAAFDQAAAGSLEMWIYPTTLNNNATLISKGATSPVSFLWGIDYNTRLMYFRIGSTTFNNTNGTVIPLNTWTHVAVTWQSAGNYTVAFYINGAISFAPYQQAATWNVNTDPIRIGGSQLNAGDFFVGKIDEVRFWSVVRTPVQIAENRFVGLGDGTNANAGNALTSNTHYTGLISSWTFNTSGTAADDLGLHNGTYNGSAISQFQDSGVPVPYNLALRCFGGQNDFVTVPSNTAFNQYTDGTIEMWFRPSTLLVDQVLISKGATVNTISFLFGVTNTGRLLFRTGGNPVASNGPPLTVNAWSHIAVTWFNSGGTFQVNFYVNGNPNGTTVTIPAVSAQNPDPLYIGGSQAFPGTPANGYIDEVRLWNPALTNAQIKTNMIASGRALLPNGNLISIWNFDGNLNNFSSTSGINGSFNNGGTNNCRLSAYLTESTPGPYSYIYTAHCSVINRGGTPNGYPIGFIQKAPFLPIPDNNPTGVSDSITIYNPITGVSSIEVFLSIKHTWVGDLIVSLRAPNGQLRNLISNNGSAADNVLSFFNDAFTNLPSSAAYLPPWAFVKPIQAFGNFSGATVNGTWTLKCVDVFAGDAGVLEGWGIRFNNAVGIEITSGNIPSRFQLYQNYPNPFNPTTRIKFSLPRPSEGGVWSVSLLVYDVLGRQVASLIPSLWGGQEGLKSGTYEITWDASSFSSGTYFYKLQAGDFTDTKKLVLVK